MSRGEKMYLSLEEMRPSLKSLYNQNRLEEDLKKRGMIEAEKIVRECFNLNLSIEEVFEKLGANPETRGDMQVIRSLFKKHKAGK
ncbi:MAG: hypothetical protein Q8M83_03965 [bacterium]|nr:hypothetical protein [bacterium]